jgi:signal transduction histidine kinase
MEVTRSADREAGGSGEELHRARRELRAMEERFRSIIQKTADGMVVVDDEGEIRFANNAAQRLFGRGADVLEGSLFGHPVVVGETTEIDIVREDGVVVAELRVMETEWEGDPARIVSLRDITDRKEAEERARELIREQAARAEAEEAARQAEFLAEAGRRLSASLALDETLQSTASLVAEHFADFCIVDIADREETRRFAAARDQDEEEALVREARAYPVDFADDSPQAVAFRDREARLVDPVTDDWLRSATRDDDHYALARSLAPRSLILAPVLSGRECLGLLTVGSTREETRLGRRQLHLAEEVARRAGLALENARLYRDAQAANRAKANFLSVMSHELRTPLGAIIGYTDLLDRGVVGDVSDRQAEYLGRIRASSNHLLQIIEEILAFASTEAGEERVDVEELGLGELMDAVTAVAEPLADDTGNELSVEVEHGDVLLRTDSRKLRQILLNLISNALKFTNEGSVDVCATVRDGQATFVVRDTGVGIPGDQLESIFERFSQLEAAATRTAGGTGLGLTVARSFARLLGGGIEVESQIDEGSTFTVRVPASAPG